METMENSGDTRYEEMFRFVEQCLDGYAAGAGSKDKIPYSRFDHTRRVYRWMMQLYEACEHREQMDLESLKIATIFHDCGYGKGRKGEHAVVGAKICRDYLKERNYSEEQITFICELISSHSDKQRIWADIPWELVLLMEADLLDDTGAHAVVMDIWMESTEEEVSFESIRDHIARFSLKQINNNPMRTPAAREIWEKKSALVKAFYESYCRDLAWEQWLGLSGEN